MQEGLPKAYLPILLSLKQEFFDGPWESEPNHPYPNANGPIGSSRDYFGYVNDASDYWSFYATSPGNIEISLEDFFRSGGQVQLFYQEATIPNRGCCRYSDTAIPD
ncbi:MAG: hypothetical protein R3C44_24465 [Chloroflexota bacterium]